MSRRVRFGLLFIVIGLAVQAVLFLLAKPLWGLNVHGSLQALSGAAAAKIAAGLLAYLLVWFALGYFLVWVREQQ